MPTSEEFQGAFLALLKSPSTKVNNGFAMMKANYRSPGRTISAARLAQAAGYSSYSTGNEQYGSFAHQVSDLLSCEPAPNETGEIRWTYTLCTASADTDQNGHFQWIMRPEVADALERLGLVEPVEFPDALADIANAANKLIGLTEKSRDAYVRARVGQGVFRERLLKHWQGCSVTGCGQMELLVASHIKPWRDCSVAEATDMTNGLLLIPNIDRAFDKGFVTFNSDGGMILSPQASQSLALHLGINVTMKLRHIYPQHQPYLEYHRAHVYRSTS